MINLQDKKMPVIIGINDVPSIIGEPSHPNGSLLCQRYNELVETIENELNSFRNDITVLESNSDFKVVDINDKPPSTVFAVELFYNPNNLLNDESAGELIFKINQPVLVSISSSSIVENTLIEVEGNNTITFSKDNLSIVAQEENGVIRVNATLDINTSDFFVVLPITFSIETQDLEGNNHEFPITILFLNSRRITESNYDWNNATSYN